MALMEEGLRLVIDGLHGLHGCMVCMVYWQFAWPVSNTHRLLVEHVAWERNMWPDGMRTMFVDLAYCHVWHTGRLYGYWHVIMCGLHCEASLIFQCCMGDLDLKYMLSFDLN